MSKKGNSGLTGFCHVGASAGLDRLDRRVLGCAVGQFPWDEWERRARAWGVEEKLAGLGREVMREAYQHGWSKGLQRICGWEDQGEEMLLLALEDPEEARESWKELLETDGYRGRWECVEGQWRWR